MKNLNKDEITGFLHGTVTAFEVMQGVIPNQDITIDVFDKYVRFTYITKLGKDIEETDFTTEIKVKHLEMTMQEFHLRIFEILNEANEQQLSIF